MLIENAFNMCNLYEGSAIALYVLVCFKLVSPGPHLCSAICTCMRGFWASVFAKTACRVSKSLELQQCQMGGSHLWWTQMVRLAWLQQTAQLSTAHFTLQFEHCWYFQKGLKLQAYVWIFSIQTNWILTTFLMCYPATEIILRCMEIRGSCSHTHY